MFVVDLASVLGLLLCISLIIYGIVSGDDGWASLINFGDFASVLITLGGSFSSVLTMFSVKDYIGGVKSFALVLKVSDNNTPEIIRKIIDLSNVARKEGLLSLEEAASDLNDDFLKKGILLIVDGTDPDLVRAIMETELISIEGRHRKRIAFWDSLASMGPAWGMIGTLIGLINMLNKMSDVASVGPNMSIALITTLYGSMLANWICIPVSTKLKNKNDDEMMVKEIMIEGLLSIQAGENPRVIEEKLKSFLAPADRVSAGSEEGGMENG